MDENRLESTSKSCNAVCLLFIIIIIVIPTRKDMTLHLPEPRFSSIFLSDIHGNAKNRNNVRLLYHKLVNAHGTKIKPQTPTHVQYHMH